MNRQVDNAIVTSASNNYKNDEYDDDYAGRDNYDNENGDYYYNDNDYIGRSGTIINSAGGGGAFASVGR